MTTKIQVNLRDLSWAAIGATVAMAVALWLVSDRHSPFLLASLGGSTVFLFALTDAEAAQPRDAQKRAADRRSLNPNCSPPLTLYVSDV
jgi:CBS-domain-containing membrane protein